MLVDPRLAEDSLTWLGTLEPHVVNADIVPLESSCSSFLDRRCCLVTRLYKTRETTEEYIIQVFSGNPDYRHVSPGDAECTINMNTSVLGDPYQFVSTTAMCSILLHCSVDPLVYSLLWYLSSCAFLNRIDSS